MAQPASGGVFRVQDARRAGVQERFLRRGLMRPGKGAEGLPIFFEVRPFPDRAFSYASAPMQVN